jgi:16S rRNA (uracil1498-N3)-methyltransferase
MDIPFFFSPDLFQQTKTLLLDEANSKHAVQVLRMQAGETLQLANGKGVIATAKIIKADKKKTEMEVEVMSYKPLAFSRKAIAISLVKNAARFEWFLEKATEVGITEIIPLICQRTERQLFKKERWEQILVSAMLQSKQVWMPVLHEPVALKKWLENENLIASDPYQQRFIAHCLPNEKTPFSSILQKERDALILIGPEGDFTPEEIEQAVGKNFLPVALGETRLRTETAGIVAAVLMKM